MERRCFCIPLRYLLDKAHELIDYKDYEDLFPTDIRFPEVSVLTMRFPEKENSIAVMRFDGQWKDLGTWNTLTESIPENIMGKGIMDETCNNVHIINELNVPVLAMGLSDVVISAGPRKESSFPTNMNLPTSNLLWTISSDR